MSCPERKVSQNQRRGRQSAVIQNRRRGRHLAIILAYAYEQKSYQDDEALYLDDDENGVFAEASWAFGQDLLQDFIAHRQAIDQVVDGCLTNWTIGRLAILDRCLLRMGCCELLHRPDIPIKTIFNEYIELAKSYGSDARTAGLVNGVLDSIARAHRPAAEMRPARP